MNLADAVFLLFAGITLVGAFMAVSFKNVFYNALSLILCLFGVAGLFLYLNSEFLAVMEVIIYIGAIAVAIIFAVMLTRDLAGNDLRGSLKNKILAALASIFVVGMTLKAIFATNWPLSAHSGDYSLKALGRSLLSTYVLPFEIISAVLLVAIIGALVISSKEESA